MFVAAALRLVRATNAPKQVTRSEVVGRTDVFAGNRYIGSNDQVAYWFEDVRRKTTFSKTVHLKDGEAMQVTLDKSMLGCFLICR